MFIVIITYYIIITEHTGIQKARVIAQILL